MAIETTHYYDLFCEDKANNSYLFLLSDKSFSKSSRHSFKGMDFSRKNGSVLTGHCDCMAGLSEACSHIGAMLFACETGARMQNSVTCTGSENKWLMPCHVKEIPYLPVSEMDLSSAKQKHALLTDKGKVPMTLRDLPVNKNRGIRPTTEEQNNFFLTLASVKASLPFCPLLNHTMNCLWLKRKLSQIR